MSLNRYHLWLGAFQNLGLYLQDIVFIMHVIIVGYIAYYFTLLDIVFIMYVIIVGYIGYYFTLQDIVHSVCDHSRVPRILLYPVALIYDLKLGFSACSRTSFPF